MSDPNPNLPNAVNQTYSQLSNYRIEKKIGRGQFSEVIRAVFLPKNQPVALKLVKIFDMLDAKTRQDCMKIFYQISNRLQKKFHNFLIFSYKRNRSFEAT